tara:strand:+ start:742 stop:1371 length:630 start_codon:yes stop_codon:yes gene_type:complete
MAIKIKYKDPKQTDFGPNDIVININTGTLFYKSNKSIFKLQGANVNTTNDLIHVNSNISAQKGFFSSTGVGTMRVGTEGIDKFTVGSFSTLEVEGHIMPPVTPSPKYDLGSLRNPWRDLYLSPSSLHFVKTSKGVGASRIGTTFIIGKYRTETIPEEEETLTKDNITDLKAGKSISGSRDLTIDGRLKVALGITLNAGGITGSIDGGSW